MENKEIEKLHTLPKGTVKFASELTVEEKIFQENDSIPLAVLNNLDNFPTKKDYPDFVLIDMIPTEYRNKDGSIRYIHTYLIKDGKERSPAVRNTMTETPIGDEP